MCAVARVRVPSSTLLLLGLIHSPRPSCNVRRRKSACFSAVSTSSGFVRLLHTLPKNLHTSTKQRKQNTLEISMICYLSMDTF